MLNIGARKVLRSGSEVHLTPKEFALLEFFMRNPNQVFSVEALLERVWPADCESTTETVVAAVYRLRKKIDAFGTKNTIQNVFGAGYVLPTTELKSQPKP